MKQSEIKKKIDKKSSESQNLLIKFIFKFKDYTSQQNCGLYCTFYSHGTYTIHTFGEG